MRGAHGIPVEFFALDLAGFEDILGQGGEDGLFLLGEAQALHPADKLPLPQPDGSEPGGQGIGIPGKAGPFGQLMEVGHYSPHILR